MKFQGFESSKMTVLVANHAHDMLHYGNLITYMRIKNIIPPTSDSEFMQQLMKK